MTRIKVDFRLLDISLELYALRDSLQLIEKQITHLKKTEKRRMDAKIKKLGATLDEDKLREIKDEYDYRVNVLFPRFFRAPFLVSLYGVYESAVIEVAELMKKKQSQPISIHDLRGDLLGRAKIYFNHILHFKLCNREEDWRKIKILSELRHALAHANGRIEMLNERTRKNILAMEKQKIGLTLHHGYIIIEVELARNLFESVWSNLRDLALRYKKWEQIEGL